MPSTIMSCHPLLGRLGDVASLYVIVICGINLVSVILQSGLSECHTFGCRLLR